MLLKSPSPQAGGVRTMRRTAKSTTPRLSGRPNAAELCAAKPKRLEGGEVVCGSIKTLISQPHALHHPTETPAFL